MIINCKSKFFTKFLFLSVFLLIAGVCWCTFSEHIAISAGAKKRSKCAEKVQVQQETIINRLEKIETRFKIGVRN